MTDIRQREDVLRVYWEMNNVTDFYHKMESMFIASYPNPSSQRCIKCNEEDVEMGNHCPVPDPITMPVEKLAFFMRDKCDPAAWLAQLYEVSAKPGALVGGSTSSEWIKAAVKAWEGKAK